MDERSEVERRGAGAPEAGLPPRFVPAVPHAAPQPPPGGSGGRTHVWRRFTRSRRGAAGLGIAAAALLLWPFSGWAWLPWLAGLGALVVLRILRLDGLLRGWAWHLGGLVVVAGLMLSSDPWAWAFAASIGVLLAGLAQLPWWRLAAVGAVLCAGTGAGFWVSSAEEAEVRAQAQAQANLESRAAIAEPLKRVLPVLVGSVDGPAPDPGALCALLDPAAEAQLATATASGACADAVRILHGRLTTMPDSRAQPTVGPAPNPLPMRTTLDACETRWRDAAGPELGRVQASRVLDSADGYIVTGFSPC